MNNSIPMERNGVVLRPRRNTILLVEDDDDQWLIIRWSLLHTRPDIHLVRTTNMAETLTYLAACLHEHRPLPALILLDLYLPRRRDGWALLEAIKLHHTFRRLPVVMLSSSANPEDIEQSYFLRSSSYLVKPTSYPDWMACFDRFLHYWLEAITLPENSG